VEACAADPTRMRQGNAETVGVGRNTGGTVGQAYSRCSQRIRPKPTVNVAAVRAFRPRVMSGAGASLSRLSRRFDPLVFDSTTFASVSTMYKRKAQKVLPVNQPRLTGDGPGGEARWKEKVLVEEKERLRDQPRSKWDDWLIPRFAETPEGTRLTPDRIEKLHIGPELRPEEREVLLQVLKNREMALAWNFSEIGRVRPEVAPPQEIHTVKHEPWRAPNFPVPRALQETVCQMLRERLEQGILEYCNGPYRNP
jgi:hypothetical protein